MEEIATVAPAAATRWPLEDVVLIAPEGRMFVSAIVRDFDGDGAKDAFALVRTTDGSGSASIAYYRGQGSPTLTPSSTFPPPDVARDPTCADVAKLALIGKRSVLAEIGALCQGRAGAAADRWVGVVDAAPPTAVVRLALTVTDPANAGVLSFDGDVSDSDGDGRDDVRLVVSLEGGGPPFEPGPRVSASFVWLDRPAGLSPAPHVAEASFASLAAQAAARAGRAKDAPEVPAFAAQVRALWRAACAEGGVARVIGGGGTEGVPCGALRPLAQVGLAESHAYATSRDGLRAVLALEAAERPPLVIPAARLSEAEKWVMQVAPVANARSVRSVAAVPMDTSGHEPAWGALAFEPSGKLLVRTRAGVVRVDPDAGDEVSADAVEWRSAVLSPDGAMRWIEAYDPCDGLALRATFASGDDLRDVPLPVAPPVGGRCTGSRGAPAVVFPVAWTTGGLEAIVDEVPVLIASDLSRASPLGAFLDRSAPLGAPLSRDGKTIVLPTHIGLLEKGPGRTRLLRASGLEGTFAEQHDCTSSNDGTHVACVHAGQAWVAAWD